MAVVDGRRGGRDRPTPLTSGLPVDAEPMSTPGGPVRAAGRGALPDGSVVIWVVSEGRRGRRWRETITTGEGPDRGPRDIRSSLLLETDPSGRFLHLELSTAAGLLTLHPEGDGSLHGNAVSADGVRHVVGLPFPAGAVVVVAGSPIAAAAALGSARGTIGMAGDAPIGERRIPAAFVQPDLGVSTGDAAIREAPDGWQVGEGTPLRLDADGLPVLPDPGRWSLELGASSWTDRGQPGTEPAPDTETRG
jgi:hypothetical protein